MRPDRITLQLKHFWEQQSHQSAEGAASHIAFDTDDDDVSGSPTESDSDSYCKARSVSSRRMQEAEHFAGTRFPPQRSIVDKVVKKLLRCEGDDSKK